MRLLLTALSVFVADQLSKIWVFNNLDMDTGRIVVLEDFFYIVHVGNEGAAWGIFSGHGGPLTLFALIALVAIYFFRESLQLKKTPVQWLFGLICGGILGNTVDRMIHGHVIDFLDFRLPVSIPSSYPTVAIRRSISPTAESSLESSAILFLVFSTLWNWKIRKLIERFNHYSGLPTSTLEAADSPRICFLPSSPHTG